MSKSDKPLFSHHEHALEKAYEVCPECGSELSIKRGKSGPFWGCGNFPTCSYTRATIEHERVDDQELPGSECPLCSSVLAVKQGRYGMFIGCSNYPTCHHIEHEAQHEATDIACPSCKKGHIKERQSRFGKTFYACDAYPKCKFAVNHEPVQGNCQHCGFTLLLKRNMASGEKLQCGSKKCSEFQK